MTLIEALKSGKPLRRRGYYYSSSPAYNTIFSVEDVLATDWEIIEPKVEITIEQLRIAHMKAFQKANGFSGSFAASCGYHCTPTADEIAKELGL